MNGTHTNKKLIYLFLKHKYILIQAYRTDTFIWWKIELRWYYSFIRILFACHTYTHTHTHYIHGISQLYTSLYVWILTFTKLILIINNIKWIHLIAFSKICLRFINVRLTNVLQLYYFQLFFCFPTKFFYRHASTYNYRTYSKTKVVFTSVIMSK